ncbi:ADP-ribosylation factor family-domain-containing protein [Podospora conica]|nr:ADP-ribosylation factor family-domain-containing protein [Schizothecium conicum]
MIPIPGPRPFHFFRVGLPLSSTSLHYRRGPSVVWGRYPLIDGDMEDRVPTIFDLSYSCEVLFCQTASDSSHSDSRLAPGRTRLEELHQRFTAWISYLGALAPGHGSLDHRLRFSTEVRSMVAELLLLLQRNLSTVLDAGTTDLAGPLQALRGGVDRLYQVGVAIRKSSTVGLSSRIQAFSDKYDDEDYFFSLALEILKMKFPDADAVICAHLAATIKFRRQQIRYQRRHQSKLQSLARIVADQHSPALVLPSSPGPPNAADETLDDGKGIKMAPSQTSASTFLAKDFMRHLNAPPSVPSETQGHEPLTAPSVMSSGSTVIEYGNLPFPSPPAAQDATSASCAWCFQEHTSEQYTDTRWWRRHVLSCLQPFACLSEECKEPHKLFSSEVDWKSHMADAHGAEWPRDVHKPTQWFCDIDHPEGETVYFSQEQELAQHLREVHPGTFNENQIPIVLSQNTVSTQRDRHVCPLCNCVPDRLSRLITASLSFGTVAPRAPKLIRSLASAALSGNSPNPGSESSRSTRFVGANLPDKDEVSAEPQHKTSDTDLSFKKELERHIARHLKSIAFISIRNLASEDETTSNASAQGQCISQNSSLRTDDEASESSLLIFEDIPPDARVDMQDLAAGESDVWQEPRAEAELDVGLEPNRAGQEFTKGGKARTVEGLVIIDGMDADEPWEMLYGPRQRATDSAGLSTTHIKEPASGGEAERQLRSVLRQTERAPTQQEAKATPVAESSRPGLRDISTPVKSTYHSYPRLEYYRDLEDEQEEIDITFVGLSGCGKTALLRSLAGNGASNFQRMGSTGFEINLVQRGRTTIKFWDLSEQPQFRSLWERYCRGVNAIVFAVNLSSSHRHLMPEAKEAIHELVDFPSLAGIPLLVLGLYAYDPDSLSVDELVNVLELKNILGRKVSCQGPYIGVGTNLDAVMEWILDGA